MSRSSTPEQHQHGQEGPGPGSLMFIGERCALEECGREDFLPFKCADCTLSFCALHFRPTAHACASHDASAGDYRVPLCPLCGQPPANWRRDEDPNIAMEAHLSSRCPAIDENGLRKDGKGVRTAGKSRAKKDNVCRERKCTKIMLVPMMCPQCHLAFCPTHRHPSSHACAAPSTSASPSALSTKTSSLSGRNAAPPARILQQQQQQQQQSPRNTPAALAAMKRFAGARTEGTSAGAGAQSTKSEAGSTSAGKGLPNPFNKMDKRARAERASAIRALQARQAKGLLTPVEEVRLAEELALMQRSGNGKDDCIIS